MINLTTIVLIATSVSCVFGLILIAWGFFAKHHHRRIMYYRHMLDNHHGVDNATFHETLNKKRKP